MKKVLAILISMLLAVCSLGLTAAAEETEKTGLEVVLAFFDALEIVTKNEYKDAEDALTRAKDMVLATTEAEYEEVYLILDTLIDYMLAANYQRGEDADALAEQLGDTLGNTVDAELEDLDDTALHAADTLLTTKELEEEEVYQLLLLVGDAWMFTKEVNEDDMNTILNNLVDALNNSVDQDGDGAVDTSIAEVVKVFESTADVTAEDWDELNEALTGTIASTADAELNEVKGIFEQLLANFKAIIDNFFKTLSDWLGKK